MTFSITEFVSSFFTGNRSSLSNPTVSLPMNYRIYLIKTPSKSISVAEVYEVALTRMERVRQKFGAAAWAGLCFDAFQYADLCEGHFERKTLNCPNKSIMQVSVGTNPQGAVLLFVSDYLDHTKDPQAWLLHLREEGTERFRSNMLPQDAMVEANTLVLCYVSPE